MYKADPAWANRTTYFTVGSVATSPNLWTFSLVVSNNTPVDAYEVQTQMAGRNAAAGLWSQQETFYLQVVSASVPVPVVLSPQRSGSTFFAGVAIVSGFTYYLEYKTALGTGVWTTVAQTVGDGTTKTLTDTTATDPARFYRMRVQ